MIPDYHKHGNKLMFSVSRQTSFEFISGYCGSQSQRVLPASEVAGKVILVPALTAADITLEGVLVAVATHVNGIHDVV